MMDKDKLLEEAEALIKWLDRWSGLKCKSKECQAWLDKYKEVNDGVE
jgi:hypothetical protein